MEVNRLLSDELTYEILVRGYPAGSTVEEKRATLRKVLRMEREGAFSAPVSILLDANDEISTCHSKISGLEAEIRSFNHENRKNEFERLYTRLLHVISRLGRIIPVDENQNREKQTLTLKSRQLIGELNLVYDGVTYTEVERASTSTRIASNNSQRLQASILDSPNPLIPEVVHSRININSANSQFQNSDNPIPEIATELPLDENRSANVNVPQTRSQPFTASREYDANVNHCAQACVPPHLLSSRLDDSNVGGLTSRFPIDGNEARSNRFTPRVRFTEETDMRNRDNWSRVADDYDISNVYDTLPSADPSSFANKLAALHLSPVDQLRNVRYGDRFNFIDVNRWNVKYDGLSSVNNFLDRIEELRISRGVTKDYLLRSAAELFTRDALLWYRTNQFRSWDDLVLQLRETFQPYDYENGIWDELRRRTQGAQERVVIFVAAMEQLFNRLSVKPSEEDRLKLIRRNLLPYLQKQLALHQLQSIRDLVRVCRAIEETEIRVQQFCPPPTNYRNLLEPELAYRKPSNNSFPISSLISTGVNPVSQTETVAAIQSTPGSSRNPASLCWNCRDTGHRFRQCKQPRRMFCYKCGHENVIATRCPNCTKNSGPGQQ